MNVPLPTSYDITYPIKNIKYYSDYGKKKIVPILLLGCKNYCMYCGKTIEVEGDKHFQVEHSVDKDGNLHEELNPNDVLRHCKYNLAIACPECNLTCKKIVDKIDYQLYMEKCYPGKDVIPKCPSTCEKTCPLLDEIRTSYITKNAIILQPLGIDSTYGIVFDVFKQLFVPEAEGMSEKQIFLTQNHIDRFRLNSDRFTFAVLDVCDKVVALIESGVTDSKKIFDILSLDKYQNIIGEEFASLLKQTFEEKNLDELGRFCKLIIVLSALP